MRSKPLFSLEEACTGICATGRPGGGKSTYLRWIARQLVAMGCYICWTCIKPDECANALRVIPNAFVFRPGTGVFNPLTFELSRKGGSARNLAAFHDDLNEVLTRSDTSRTEPFWKNGAEDTLAYAFDTVYLVLGKDATYGHVNEMIMTSPVDCAYAASEFFKQSYCGKMLAAARSIDEEKSRPARDYFTNKLPSVGERARGAIITQATASIAPFLYGPIAEVVNGVSTVTPESLLTHHTILDLDVLTYGKSGHAFQLIMAWFLMDAILRRTGKFSPFVLFRDEYHLQAHPERDVRALSVGRSQKLISVAAFQSIPVLETFLGGSLEAQTQAKAVYGLHVNKVMVNNNCHATNEFNSMVIGQHKEMFCGGSINRSNDTLQWWDIFGVGASPAFNFSQQWNFIVPPTTFLNLRSGGKENQFIVDAVIHKGQSHFFHSLRQK